MMQEVATFTASCEKHVGTESGGMDQAISLMGEQGIAKLIEFNPVSTLDSGIQSLTLYASSYASSTGPTMPCLS